MILTSKATSKIRNSNRLRALLAAEFDKTTNTIDNWIENNSPMLTTASALKVIRLETGLTDAEILTEQTATK